MGTSGTLVLAAGRPGTEQDAPDRAAPAARRVPAEEAATTLAQRGVRSSVVRLAPTVHSPLDRYGFVPALVSIARRAGVSAYVADGANRWPAVHTLDAARLYRLALENAPAGSRWHGAADEGIAFRDIAESIGRHLNLPVTSIPSGQAADHFGWLSFAASADNPTSSSLTRQLLGWRPEHPGLLAALEEGHYFTQ